MNAYTVEFRDGKAWMLGIEQPAAVVIKAPYYIKDGVLTDEALLATDPDPVLVLHVPGHSYWSGRAESSYARAEFQVYRITSATSAPNRLRVSRITEFSAPRKGGS